MGNRNKVGEKVPYSHSLCSPGAGSRVAWGRKRKKQKAVMGNKKVICPSFPDPAVYEL